MEIRHAVIIRGSSVVSVTSEVSDIVSTKTLINKSGCHVCHIKVPEVMNDSDILRRKEQAEPVKEGDVPGWETISLKTGEYAGCIGVNEMVAFKLPMNLYEAYMREAHHVQPLAEEQKLTSVIDVIREEAAQVAKRGAQGIKIEVEPGMAELGVDLDPGSFAETLGEVDKI